MRGLLTKLNLSNQRKDSEKEKRMGKCGCIFYQIDGEKEEKENIGQRESWSFF